MKLVHQLKEVKAEKELAPAGPLSFFLPNKQGSVLFFDAEKDVASYHADISGTVYKPIKSIRFQGKLGQITNRISSLELSRGNVRHTFFVPYYMDAFIISSSDDMPVDLVIGGSAGLKDAEPRLREDKGRLVFSHVPYASSGKPYCLVISGDNLRYDCKKSKVDGCYELHAMSRHIIISVAEKEQDAISAADHLFANQTKIEKVQQNYVSTLKLFTDPEASLAYACVLHGTDHMFIHDTINKISPLHHFSKLNEPYKTLAINSLLAGSEFKSLKEYLNRKLHLLRENETFPELAWPVYLFGKMLNDLCREQKLYKYFLPVEIKELSSLISEIVPLIESKFSAEERECPASCAMMLAIRNFSRALTKSHNSRISDEELREMARNILCSNSIIDGSKHRTVTSVLLAAEVYPALLSQMEWKRCIDSMLDNIQNDFRSLQKKTIGEELDIEVFGLSSLAATVMHRIDPQRYRNQVDTILTRNIRIALYSGLIGRPSTAYDLRVDLDKKPIRDEHLLNNALFLEMLRECA